jgi:DUF1680 family protein
MSQLTKDAKYADVMERALYNNVLAGVSLDGTRYFYDNVLESRGDKHRFDWHPCPCCPPNVLRLLASFGAYIYNASPSEISVDLYVQGSAELRVAGTKLKLHQTTSYPWDGNVKIKLELEQAAQFGLRLRIPGWSRGATLKINNQIIELGDVIHSGYAVLERTWNTNDEIRLEFPMTIERVRAHPSVRADAGQVALQRGPILYCLEAVDHNFPLHQIVLEKTTRLEAHFEADLLEGVTVITGMALAEDLSAWSGKLYRMDQASSRAVPIKAIPYFAWDNREAGEMRVWIRSE